MCKVKTPSYTPPPKPKERARELAPDNAALHEEAATRAAMRGGGQKRQTILTGLQGAIGTPALGEGGTALSPTRTSPGGSGPPISNTPPPAIGGGTVAPPTRKPSKGRPTSNRRPSDWNPFPQGRA